MPLSTIPPWMVLAETLTLSGRQKKLGVGDARGQERAADDDDTATTDRAGIGTPPLKLVPLTSIPLAAATLFLPTAAFAAAADCRHRRV